MHVRVHVNDDYAGAFLIECSSKKILLVPALPYVNVTKSGELRILGAFPQISGDLGGTASRTVCDRFARVATLLWTVRDRWRSIARSTHPDMVRSSRWAHSPRAGRSESRLADRSRSPVIVA